MQQQKTRLVEDIHNFIDRYVFLPSDEAGLIMALHAIHTWNMQAAQATPYLYIHSPEKQAGKTRFLEVDSLLVRNPIMASSLTDAVLFRMIEEFQPTLIIDEVDAVFHGAKNEGLRGGLNSGYRRSGHVWRVQKGDPHRFRTFCPKILAGINNGALPDTVADRSLAIRMRRKPKNETREPFYLDEVRNSAELEHILKRIENWSDLNGDHLAVTRPDPISEISDRKWEISEPLIAIAKLMQMEDEARAAIINLCGEEDEGLSEQQELLLDIKAAFGDRERIMTADLIERLGRDMNGKLLGNKLKPYGIQPRVIRIGNQTGRGYMKSDFVGAWESYL